MITFFETTLVYVSGVFLWSCIWTRSDGETTQTSPSEKSDRLEVWTISNRTKLIRRVGTFWLGDWFPTLYD